MKCLNCDKQVNQVIGKKKRQFCGDACRMAYNRKANKSEQKSEQSNPNTLKANTPNGLVKGAIVPSLRDDKETRKVGQCSFCGADVSTDYGNIWDLVECCHICVK